MSRRGLVYLIIIAAVTVAVYSNSFDVPFQWDDRYYLEANPIITDLGYFSEPSRARPFKFYSAIKRRYVGFLSFALNYRLHGFDVRGYHAVNVAVHAANALLLYLIVSLTFMTPGLRGSALTERRRELALFVALLFAAHPVQTEAVTYVYQRLASLVAFFYLLSLAAYIKSRLTGGTKGRYGFYALSIAGAVLAMKTKENAFTLPLAIVMYEFVFFDGRVRERLLRLAPILLTLLIIPLTLAGPGASPGGMAAGLGEAVKGFEKISRADYFFTQMRVIVTYLRLLFLPVNQNIDYDYTIYRTFFDAAVLLSAALIVALIALGAYLLRRSRRGGEPALRLAAFGIFWFFLALSVESSVIPIPMVINEYRVYLPSAGAFMAIIAGLYLAIKRLAGSVRALNVFATLLALAVFILGSAAYARNEVWRTDLSLWEDTVRKSPGKARTRDALGSVYWAHGRSEDAIREFRAALRIDPNFPYAHYNLGHAYGALGDTRRAIMFYEAALALKPDYDKPHFNLGVIYLGMGQKRKARQEFVEALRYNPYNTRAQRFLDYIEGGGQ